MRAVVPATAAPLSATNKAATATTIAGEIRRRLMPAPSACQQSHQTVAAGHYAAEHTMSIRLHPLTRRWRSEFRTNR